MKAVFVNLVIHCVLQLNFIKVADGSHLWSETYDRDMEDIFKIQDDIADEVTKQLKISLLGDIAKSTEVNPDAYGPNSSTTGAARTTRTTTNMGTTPGERQTSFGGS